MHADRRVRKTARRLFRDCRVHDLLDEDRVRFVTLQVIESKRRHGLAVLSNFLRLVRLDRERRTARIETASPLPSDARARVEAQLVRAYGSGLVSSFIENPSLIGGMRIKVGSDIYDGSVRARLAALEASF
jgi:F-type H+-transporting ATPase subunit delta